MVSEHFVQKCSVFQNMSSLPTFVPRINNKIEDISIQKHKVLTLIRLLDTKKAHGCDQTSSAMIKICDSSILDPLCMISEKYLGAGSYPSSWKKLMSYLSIKRRVGKARTITGQSLCYQYLEKYLKNCYLTTYINT